jgi:hypothetical protein
MQRHGMLQGPVTGALHAALKFGGVEIREKT